MLSAEGEGEEFRLYCALPVLMFGLMSELDFDDEFNVRLVHWSIGGSSLTSSG